MKITITSRNKITLKLKLCKLWIATEKATEMPHIGVTSTKLKNTEKLATEGTEGETPTKLHIPKTS